MTNWTGRRVHHTLRVRFQHQRIKCEVVANRTLLKKSAKPGIAQLSKLVINSTVPTSFRLCCCCCCCCCCCFSNPALGIAHWSIPVKVVPQPVFFYLIEPNLTGWHYSVSDCSVSQAQRKYNFLENEHSNINSAKTSSWPEIPGL